MARKGSRKTRTGCYTCKIRKVKCDETKPECSNCTKTGRMCDGYPPLITAVSSPALPQQPSNHLTASRVEANALQFFQVIVGPALSGFLQPSFWTELVLQFCQYEPAVRHSVVAISALYEQFHHDVEQKRFPDTSQNQSVLEHYNHAIREVVSASKDESLVLLVCILFICIEYLRGSKRTATEHCRHGVYLYNRMGNSYPWVRQYLLPMLRRMSSVPLFFGTRATAFPSLDYPLPELPPAFETLQEALYAWDALGWPALRFVYEHLHYRAGFLPVTAVTEAMRDQQNTVRESLGNWHRVFASSASLTAISDAESRTRVYLLVQCLVMKIWIEMVFEPQERQFDKHLDAFREVVDLASTIDSTLVLPDHPGPWARPRFSFETGFLPTLYFVVLKCRELSTRLEALRLLKKLSLHRENLWEADEIICASRRLIELEHGICLLAGDVPSAPIHSRVTIKDVIFVPDEATGLAPDPKGDSERRIQFMVETGEGKDMIEEWVPVTSR